MAFSIQVPELRVTSFKAEIQLLRFPATIYLTMKKRKVIFLSKAWLAEIMM